MEVPHIFNWMFRTSPLVIAMLANFGRQQNKWRPTWRQWNVKSTKENKFVFFCVKTSGFFWKGGVFFHGDLATRLFVLFYTKKFSKNEIQELLISGDRITVPGTKVLWQSVWRGRNCGPGLCKFWKQVLLQSLSFNNNFTK